MPTFFRVDPASARKKSPDSVRLHGNQGCSLKENFSLGSVTQHVMLEATYCPIWSSRTAQLWSQTSIPSSRCVWITP
jgi:hypothetical protein